MKTRNERSALAGRRVRSWRAKGVGLVLSLLFVGGARAEDFTYATVGETITITRYTGPGGSVTIPSTINGLPVKTIGSNAFFFLPAVTSVTIPEGVVSLGVEAFGNCAGLTNVTLPNSLTRIEDSAFWACTLLNNAAIPNGVTNLGQRAFAQCLSLTSISIPPSVEEVGEAVFLDCGNVTNVTIGNSVLSRYEFANCTNLTSISFHPTITSIPVGAFGGAGLTDLTIPNSVTNLGGFGSCANLTNITIPDSVISLEYDAFAGCTALGSVRIPDSVTHIGDGLLSKGVVGAFSGCSTLTNVVLGSRLRHIGDGAFFQCSSLASITIPNSVIHIGSVCFAFSPNLAAAYFQGDAPSVSPDAFVFLTQTDPTTVYYLPGTTGWGTSFASRPTALWVRPNPVILTSGPGFGAHDDGFGFIISWATNASVAVEACTNLLNPVWQTLVTNPLMDGRLDFRDPQWMSVSNRFFRVRWLR